MRITSVAIEASLAFRKDDTTSSAYIYFGEAAPGTLSSASGWRISRMTVTNGTILWADGDGDFNKIWDQRATGTYTYS